jgi:hypothetical protein
MRKPIVLGTTLAASAVAAAVIAGTGQAQDPAGRTLQIKASSPDVRYVDLAPRMRTRRSAPSTGDLVISAGTLADAAGARLGTSHLVCAITDPRGAIQRSILQCTGTWRLRDGTLSFAVADALASDRTVTAAITGGTGAYAGARGEAVSRPTGEDTSDNTVRLLP